MKKGILYLLFALILCSVSGYAEGERELTLMVYVCGSNLETEGGAASADIEEMIAAGWDESQVSVLVMTGGARRWASEEIREGICIGEVTAEGLTVVDRDEKKSMGNPETLTGLLRFAREWYPAKNYALIIWDHGAGPMGGVCLDENFSPDRLCLSELSSALEDAHLEKKLSWIGFDACLMSSVEVASVLVPYADYLIASQETEPPTGWDYAFLHRIDQDRDPLATANRVIDLYLATGTNKSDPMTLSCTDLTGIPPLMEEMDRFFARVSEQMTGDEMLTRVSTVSVSAAGFGKTVRGLGENSYDLLDLRDLVERLDEEQEKAPLVESLQKAVIRSGANVSAAGGLSVYHPYRNKKEYLNGWREDYLGLSFCAGYTDYLMHFGAFLTGTSMTDWQGLKTEEEIAMAEDSSALFSLRLTPEQQKGYLSSQLVILRPVNHEVSAQFADTAQIEDEVTAYSPVAVCETRKDDQGLLTASYSGQALYVTDEEGKALAGPISYRLGSDGKIIYIQGHYADMSGWEETHEAADVLFGCMKTQNGEMIVISEEVFDPLTGMYSNRMSVREEDYTELSFNSFSALMPSNVETMPGLEDWTALDAGAVTVALPEEWYLSFFEDQLSGTQLFAAFEVTDVQQNTFMSALIPVSNPNLDLIELLPQTVKKPDCDVLVHLVADRSMLNPGLSLCVELRNHGTNRIRFEMGKEILINESRSVWSDAALAGTKVRWFTVDPGESKSGYWHLDAVSLTGLTEVQELAFTLMAEEYVKDGDEYEWPISVLVTNCPLLGIAPEIGAPLAETAFGGVQLELLSLEAGKNGEVTGIVHAVNDTNSAFYPSNLRIAMEHVFVNGGMDFAPVPAHSDSCFLLRIQNRDHFSAHLAEQLGIREIQTLQLMYEDIWDITRTREITLRAPLMLPEAQDRPFFREENTVLLLEGPVSIRAERLQITENSVILRLWARNETKQDTVLQIGNWLVNGCAMENGYAPEMIIPAKGIVVGSVSMKTNYLSALKPGVDVKTIALTLRCNGYTSSPAEIRLREAVPFSAANGIVFARDFSVQKAQLRIENPLLMESDEMEMGDVRARFRAQLENTDRFGAYSPDEEDQNPEVRLIAEVSCASDHVVKLVGRDLTLNGTDLYREFFFSHEMEQGDEDWLEVRIPWQTLKSAGGLRDLSFRLQVWNTEDPDLPPEEYPLRLNVPLEVEELTEKVPVLDTYVDEDIRLELLSLDTDGDGRLSGWLRLTKRKDVALKFLNQQLLINGVCADDDLPETELRWDQRTLVPFVFENCIRVDSQVVTRPGTNGYAVAQEEHLLQRLGIAEVQEVTLSFNKIYDKVGHLSTAVFRLDTPLPVPPAVTEKQEVLLREEEGIKVSLLSMLAGEQGFSLAWQLENHSDTDVTVSLLDTYANEKQNNFGFSKTLSPGMFSFFCSTSGTAEFFTLPRRFPLDCLEMYLSVTQLEEEGYGPEQQYFATLDRPVLLTDPTGKRVPGSAFIVSRGVVIRNYPGLVKTMSLPASGQVTPRLLIAPLTESQVASFVRGEVSVCMKEYDELPGEGNAQGSVWEPVYQELVTLPLAEDARGHVSARYSGLAVSLSNGLIPVREISTETATQFHTTLDFFQMPLQYQVRIPEDPSLPPYIEVILEEWMTEENMGHHCFAEIVWYLGYDGKGGYVYDHTEAELKDLNTGEIRREITALDGIDVIAIQRGFREGEPESFIPEYIYCWDYGFLHPSAAPVERLNHQVYRYEKDQDGVINTIKEDSELVYRFHVWLSDGSDQVFVLKNSEL